MKIAVSLFVATAMMLTSVAAQETKAKKAAKKKQDPAMEIITDDPKLPRVLLIGDSISIGYTVPVRKQMAGKANIHRILTNGGPTTNGLTNLKKWLGAGKWDVIHFNWGLHDLKFMETGKQLVPIEEYEKNLRELVTQLKATGAKLIWCSTTPVPEGTLSPPRKNSDVLAYNAVAKKIMEENQVAIDDLYAYALPQIATIQRPQNVHFSESGSEVLAKQVVTSISASLPKK
jgi:lysophospholipase L1-like esterase